jgi:hypothetical protein
MCLTPKVPYSISEFSFIACCYPVDGLHRSLRFLEEFPQEKLTEEDRQEFDEIQEESKISLSTTQTNDFYPVSLRCEIHFKILRWLTLHPFPKNSIKIQSRIVQRMEFFLAFVRVVRDVSPLRVIHNLYKLINIYFFFFLSHFQFQSTPIKYTEKEFIINVLEISSFNEMIQYFKFHDIPISFDCLRASVPHLISHTEELKTSVFDHFRLWRVNVAKDQILALLIPLFRKNGGIFINMEKKEKEQIIQTICGAIESMLLIERLMTLFYSKSPFHFELGIPW